MGFQSLASCHEEVDIAWPSRMSFICSSGSSNWLTGGCRTWDRVFDLGRLMGVWLAPNVAGGGAFAQGWFDAGTAAPTSRPSLRHRPAGTYSREEWPLRPRPPLPPSAGKHVPRQTRTRADTACGNQNGIRAGTRHAQARRIHRPATAQRSRDPGSSDAAHAPRSLWYVHCKHYTDSVSQEVRWAICKTPEEDRLRAVV